VRERERVEKKDKEWKGREREKKRERMKESVKNRVMLKNRKNECKNIQREAEIRTLTAREREK